jgi:hypothetical protein
LKSATLKLFIVYLRTGGSILTFASHCRENLCEC